MLVAWRWLPYCNQDLNHTTSAFLHLGCPSKLVSIRNNLNCNQNYPKQNVCFGCFASIPKQRVLMFRLDRNKQKTNRNSWIEGIFWYFYENLGLFRFVSKQFCLFRYMFETPKQTKIFSFWFHIFVVDSESRAKAHSQLLVRQRVIFLVAGSSLVALFFYAQAGQGLCSVLSVFTNCSIR